MSCENHAIGAPAPADKGFPPTPSLTLPVSLPEAISQAKQQYANTGKSNAYATLLEEFHKAILPAFFAECGNNLSDVSRLLGIHRDSTRKYAASAKITRPASKDIIGDTV